MNRIKHFMILALALAMSLGAWAQQEVLLTTVTATGETSYSQSPDGIVTVTLNNIGYYDDYQYGWLGGTVTVEANQGYTITRCVFRQQNTGSIEDDLAPFTATMSGYSTDNVSVETSNGHVNGDADQMIGITSIEVYGYAADPSPTVTHNTDGSWGFTMPDYDAALNVTYYSLPALAWTYNSAAMPAEGLTAYRGFELPVIGGIGASMDEDFLTALQGGTVSLRYGSVNGVVTFTNPYDRLTATVTGSGLDTVYMVFDGNDDYLCDSAFFAVNILDPDTLTLAANGNGTGTVSLDGYTPGTEEQSESFTTNQRLNTYTGQNFTVTCTNAGDDDGIQIDNNNPITITSTNGQNITRVEFHMTFGHNDISTISSSTGTVVGGSGDVTEGNCSITGINATSVSFSSSILDYVQINQITVYYGTPATYPDGIAATETENTYLVLPGTQVKVIATPDSAHYFVNWDEETALNSNTAVEKTLTMGTDNMTLTANFAAKPTLTLAANNSDWGSVEVAKANEVENMTIGTGGSLYTGTHFNLAYTAHQHASYGVAGFTMKSGQNATITATDGKVISKVVLSVTAGSAYNQSTTTSAGTIETEWAGSTITINGINATEVVISNTNSTGVTATNVAIYYQGTELPAGVVDNGDGTYRVDYGTEVTVIATANAGYHMYSWSNDDEVTNLLSDTAETITMTEDVTLTATFAQNPTLTIASNNSEWGSLDIEGVGSGKDKFVTDANQLVYTGRHVKVTATDLYDVGVIRLKDEGQQATIETLNGEIIDSIVVTASMNTHNCSYVLSTSGTVQGGNPTTKIRNINAASVVLTAQYGVGISNITVYYTSPDNIDVVAIDYESGIYSVLPGTEVTVNATANEGYYVTGWKDENNSDMATATYSEGLYPVTSSLSFTVTGDTTSMAIFEQSFISPELAWSAETFTAYTTIDFNNWKPTLTNPQNLDVRYGCVEGSVITEGGIPVDEITGIIGAELGIGTVSTKAGTYHIYAVHDFDGNYDYDSVVYTLVVENSATVLVQKNIEEGGAVDFVEPENDLTHNYTNSATLKSVFLAPGADFSVTNTAAEGYHFAKWQTGDNVNGYTDYSTEPNLTYTAPAEFTGNFVVGLKAVFDTNIYNVAYNVQNDTRPQIGTNAPMGSVVLEGQHKHFLNDVLTATAADGYIFAGWANTSGTVVSTENPFVFSPVSDTTLTATFTASNYTLSATPNIPTSGQVTGSGSYAYSSDVTLEATPSTGYHFVNWVDGSGNVLGTSTELSVQILSDVSVTAVFDTNIYNVAYNVQNDTRPQVGTNAPMGSVVVEGQHKHFLNDVLTATAADGYIFAGWANASGTVVSTENPFVFSPVSDTTLTATFIASNYTLSATPNIPTSGQVTGSGSYAYHSTVTLEATPSTGYHFVNWVDGSGNVLGTSTELSVQLLSDSSVTAVFDTNVYNVAYNVQNDTRPQIGTNAPMGSVVVEGQHKHFLNDVLTATAADGYIFAGWANASGTVVSTLNPFAFSPVSDTTLTATFTASNYTLSATPNIPTSGIVTGIGSYAYHSTVTLEATPSTGYHFVNWVDGSGNVLGISTELSVQLLSDVSVIAVFDTNIYNVAYNVQNDTRPQIGTNAPMGSVVLEGQHKHFLNDVLTATAADGYIFTGWANASGTVVSTLNPFAFSPVSDTTLTATFTASNYTLSATPNIPTSGIVTGNGSYAYRSTVTLEATPSIGYHFVNWVDGSGNVLGTSTELSVQLLSDVSVIAVFDTNIYNVMANVNIAGLGTVTGAGQVKHFLSTNLVATANLGYHFVHWIDNAGNELGTANTITVFPVSDTVLTAVFEANIYSTVWSGSSTTTYNSQPYTGLVAKYIDFQGNEHTPMLTFTNGSTTITTPNYPVNAGTWTVTATGEVGDVLTNTVNTLVINPAVVYVSNAVVETAKFVDGNTDAVVTNIGTLNNVQGNDVVTHNTTAVFNDATVGEGKTITLTYSLNGDSELLANYNLDPATQVYTTNAYIIEPMTPDTNRVSTEDTTVVEEGMDIYAYGYCSGSTYSIRYHLNSGNPDQYKIDFADNRFTDVDWTDLAIAGTDGTIDIEVPVDLPTGDYTLTVTFRDSRFTWLESKPISVSFHVNLPETYTVVLFDNVIALVDTCHCFTDIQWYHRADASSDWYAIPGATGYYYHATDAQLKGEFFVKVRMNGIETYTCPQTDMETLYSDNEQSVSVKAYPNPATERVTIAISGSTEPIHKLRIINNLGVEMESITFEGDSTVINMSNYQQGNYMVTVDGAVVIVIRN